MVFVCLYVEVIICPNTVKYRIVFRRFLTFFMFQFYRRANPLSYFLELTISPLEFIEVLVGASSVYVTTDILHKHQCSNVEAETKGEFLEANSKTAGDSVLNGNETAGVSNGEERNMSTGNNDISGPAFLGFL